MDNGKLTEVLIAYREGAKPEVRKHIDKFFIARGLQMPAKIKSAANRYHVEAPEKIAEWLSVVLDMQIPDLLVEPPNLNKIDAHGKIGLLPIGEKLASLAKGGTPLAKYAKKGLVKHDGRIPAKV